MMTADRKRTAHDTLAGRLGRASIAASVGFIASVYGAFPVALALAARFRPRPVLVTGPRPASLSVVIAAHDEASAIVQKLSDVADQRVEGAPNIEVIVASDGSTDATVALASAHPCGATVLDLPRGGKASAMNAALAVATGDVVIFTDANSRLGSDAFDLLTEPFADPDIGGTAGDQRYDARPSGTADGERSYWSYERMLKRFESAVGNVVSSTGTLHAIRRELIEKVPPDVTDDFFLSTGVVERHRRLVFVSEATAWEAPNDNAGAEYRRRVRIITRGLTGVRRRSTLLDPRIYGAYSLILFVHKVARRLVFAPLVLALLGSSVQRRRGAVWRVGWLAQVGFYGLSVIGLLAPESRAGRHRLVALPSHFCVANAAAAHAVWNVITARSFVTWTPERG